MRLHRVLPLGLGALAVAGCQKDEVTRSNPPALAAVRYMNVLPDTGNVDIRMMDQTAWTAYANNLQFRQVTEYMPTEAKARPIRVFATSTNPAITSVPLLDQTITFEAGKRYTVMLVGSTRTNTDRFVVLTDDIPACNNNVAIRAINLGGTTAALDLFLAAASGDPQPATPTFSNVAPLAASNYATKAPGATHVRIANTGSSTTALSGEIAAAPAAEAGKRPAAGSTSACSAFSAVAFPRTVAGSGAPQTAAFLSPAVVFFVDRTPSEVP
jgi:hypothetical protein